ncbi:hypothetical protein MSG28_000828 [Choristoneura fumiferana]|uniref:Uncharacterized protein n=1 Tax=Choristoneura fumiferana TaxID=7141 RepID=A0ACC0K2G8_CHOFU|nr:hypothetical protein MSG28_000828 [Choristoneura fumiferana]
MEMVDLFTPVQSKSDDTGNKVTVVGVGQVGMAAVFSMLTQGVTNNIAMVDVMADKLKGEMMDLQHGSAFMRNAKIQASTDYAISAGSRICVVTAGVRQREGESRLDLVQRNTDVLKHIIPPLSGLPKHRVIGSGTNLDSARFRYLLSEKLGIATTSCHGYIIGEHGDTSGRARRGGGGVPVAAVRAGARRCVRRDQAAADGGRGRPLRTSASLMDKGVTNNIAMVDVMADKLKGEMMDLQHGSAFMRNAKIQASTDYAISAGSRICVVTAGVRQREGESRLDLVQRNTDVLKHIIPPLSGLPKHRVIGSGTNLDSARFRYLLSEKLGIATTSCHGYIIGEHGDTSVPVWSGVNIAGVRLSDLNPKIGSDSDPENWKETHEAVVKSAYEVIRLKGYTSWAIGLSLSQLARAILTNAMSGEHGVEEEVFLSLPCVLGRAGVCDVIRQPLTAAEAGQLRTSASLMDKVQAGINF